MNIKDTDINNKIKASKVRLVDENGEFLGVVPISEALIKSKEANADLVVVDNRSDIPVCRILDYGKYKYEMKKKQKSNREKKLNKKEIQINPHIDEHDYKSKMSKVKAFIESRNRVKIVIKAHGRVVSESIEQIIKKILDDVQDFAKVQGSVDYSSPRNITIMLTEK